MSLEEVISCLEEGSTLDSSCLYPVSKVWPMGFSWSSYVAQEVLLDCIATAGIGDGQVLACDSTTPCDFSEVFAAATDDAMFFSNSGPGVTSNMAERFDEALLKRGIIKHSGKDVNDELNGACVGVSLEDGTFLSVPPARCLALMVLILALAQMPTSSPKQVHSLLGMLQWFDLLMRPKLSVYRVVYNFLRDPEDGLQRKVPHEAMQELLLGLVLGVFWKADLCRTFLPLVAASDASTTFGFGPSIARVSASTARALARVAEKQGSYVVLDGGTDWGTRAGERHQVPFSKSDFVHVFSVKSRNPAHINVLEGEAFVLLLRWLLRCKARHSSRVVVLVDSAVWLGAAAKGRSSTALNRLLRKAAALQMAGNLMVHLVLIPSAENPSDEPSRGVRIRKPSSLPKVKGAGRFLEAVRARRRRAKMFASAMGITMPTSSGSSSSF